MATLTSGQAAGPGSGEYRADAGLVLPPAAALGLVAAVAVGAVSPPAAGWALALLVMGCALAARACPVRAALVLGLVWALLADGFVVHRLGRIAIEGPADAAWLAAFVVAALLGARHGLPSALVTRLVDRVLGCSGPVTVSRPPSSPGWWTGCSEPGPTPPPRCRRGGDWDHDRGRRYASR